MEANANGKVSREEVDDGTTTVHSQPPSTIGSRNILAAVSLSTEIECCRDVEDPGRSARACARTSRRTSLGHEWTRVRMSAEGQGKEREATGGGAKVDGSVSKEVDKSISVCSLGRTHSDMGGVLLNVEGSLSACVQQLGQESVSAALSSSILLHTYSGAMPEDGTYLTRSTTFKRTLSGNVPTPLQLPGHSSTTTSVISSPHLASTGSFPSPPFMTGSTGVALRRTASGMASLSAIPSPGKFPGSSINPFGGGGGFVGGGEGGGAGYGAKGWISPQGIGIGIDKGAGGGLVLPHGFAPESNGTLTSCCVQFSRVVSASSSYGPPGTAVTQSRRVLPRTRRPALTLLVPGILLLVFINYTLMNAGLPNPMQSSLSAMTPSRLLLDAGEKFDLVGMKKRSSTGVPMHQRLLGLAAHALAEGHLLPAASELWTEWVNRTEMWIPCADRPAKEPQWQQNYNSNGHILLKAGGSFSQQRVAVCNAVAVARMLNATLVLPQLIYEGAWKDDRQLRDIFDIEAFIRTLQDDILIVDTLPQGLQSLDLEALGSVFRDATIRERELPKTYLSHVLPVLKRNGVVLLSPFINRLSHEYVPEDIQRLRCKCNFHALKFVPQLEQMGDLLIERLRQRYSMSLFATQESVLLTQSHSNNESMSDSGVHDTIKHRGRQGMVKTQSGQPIISKLKTGVVPFKEWEARLRSVGTTLKSSGRESKQPEEVTDDDQGFKFVALHTRFDKDVAASSLCNFGGGTSEAMELQQYRQRHFPDLAGFADTKAKNLSRKTVAEKRRSKGLCPLTPEEMGILLAILGYKRFTPMYVAGGEMWGRTSRMAAMQSLFPNLVAKEDLVSAEELMPFSQHPAMISAIDHIVCVRADVFVVSDSKSQPAALVSGHRIYQGTGTGTGERRRQVSSIRPNWRNYGSILWENAEVIEWSTLARYVRSSIKRSQTPLVRPRFFSVYRHPRTPGCMCYVGSEQNITAWMQSVQQAQRHRYDDDTDDDYVMETLVNRPKGEEAPPQSLDRKAPSSAPERNDDVDGGEDAHVDEEEDGETGDKEEESERKER